MCVTPLGLYLKDIVNEKPLQLEKTTSSARICIVINLWVRDIRKNRHKTKIIKIMEAYFEEIFRPLEGP